MCWDSSIPVDIFGPTNCNYELWNSCCDAIGDKETFEVITCGADLDSDGVPDDCDICPNITGTVSVVCTDALVLDVEPNCTSRALVMADVISLDGNGSDCPIPTVTFDQSPLASGVHEVCNRTVRFGCLDS